MKYFSRTRLCSLFLAFVSIAFVLQEAPAENRYKGEKTLGIELGYASRNNSAITGIEFTYRFSRCFRLAPAINYTFRHDNTDALALNINAQIPFSLNKQGSWELFPIAGIGYTSWNFHSPKGWLDEDVTTRRNRLGLNIGVGTGVNVSSGMRLGAKVEFALNQGYSSANALAFIAYIF